MIAELLMMLALVPIDQTVNVAKGTKLAFPGGRTRPNIGSTNPQVEPKEVSLCPHLL